MLVLLYRQVVALVDYLQWYLVDIPSLHKMVEWMMSYVSRDYVDEGIDESDGKQISYLVKLCNDSPESPLVSMYFSTVYIYTFKIYCWYSCCPL